jgi:outer membrane protein, adhesin transport system
MSLFLRSFRRLSAGRLSGFPPAGKPSAGCLAAFGAALGIASLLVSGPAALAETAATANAAVSGAANPAPVPDVMTLQAALQDLLNRHPLLEAAKEAVTAAEGGRSAAWRSFLVDVRLVGDYGREYISNPSTRAVEGGPETATRRQGGVVATQPLWDGLQRYTGLNLSRKQVELAKTNVITTRDGVLFEGATVFLEVLRQARLVQLAGENERRIQEQFQLEDERIQRGAGIAVDVLQAKARLQIARERRVAFEGALQEALVRYRQVFDVAPNVGVMIEPQTAPGLIPGTSDRVKEAAVSGNPVLKATGLQVDAARLRKQGAESSYYPKLDLVAAANWERDVDGAIGIRRDRSIMLVATWELTGALVGEARDRTAAAELRGARHTELQTRRKVEEEADLAWQSLDTARRRAKLLQNAVSIASEVLAARQELRNAGRETSLNVLDAESELYAARIGEVAAAFDARQAELRLLAVMGDLPRLAEGRR